MGNNMLDKFIKPQELNEDAMPNCLFELRFSPENIHMTENVINFSQTGQSIYITFLDILVEDKPLSNIVYKHLFESIELIEYNRNRDIINRKKWNVRLNTIVGTSYAYNPTPQFIAVFDKI